RPIGGRCSAALRFTAGEGGRATREEWSLEEIIIQHALGTPVPPLARAERATGVMMIPVPRAGVLRQIRGIEAAWAVPLVDAVEITAHTGETLVPWPEGSRYPGFIFARGPTPDAVEQALRAAHLRLQFVFDPAD
ncbi:MAG: phosphoribosylglycinamide synthetase, partial [Gemmatimonadetes bacterium]